MYLLRRRAWETTPPDKKLLFLKNNFLKLQITNYKKQLMDILLVNCPSVDYRPILDFGRFGAPL